MKKALSVILAMILTFGICAIGVSADDDEIRVFNYLFKSGDRVSFYAIYNEFKNYLPNVQVNVELNADTTIPITGPFVDYDDYYGYTGVAFEYANSITFSGTGPIMAEKIGAFSNNRIEELYLPFNVYTYTSSNKGLFMFADCSRLETVTIDHPSDEMLKWAFYNCQNLKNINFTDKVTTICTGMFEKCTALHNIEIPSTITTICDCAFYNSGLYSIIIPSTVTSIQPYAIGYQGTDVYSKDYRSTMDETTIGNCEFTIDDLHPDAYEISKVEGFTIYGEAGSEAERYANENGFTFVNVPAEHEHEYSYPCDPDCNICGYVRDDLTHTYDNDCDTTCNYCGETREITHHFAWVTVVNPTTENEGLAQKKCTVCGQVEDEFTMPRLSADFVTGITVSPKTIALNVGETADITAVVTPETAANKNIIWSSTDVENVTVSNGTVTALHPGVEFVIAETEDGGYKDFCRVRVNSITSLNGAVVDGENGFVYGLSPKLNSIDGFVTPLDESITITCGDSVVGTGSVIQIVRNGEIVDSYKAVIFGDVNGDGIYDAQDAFIVNCLANGLLTREQVGEAKYTAADCNHDGSVDSSDVLILEQAGLLLSQIDQSKEDYMQSDAYAEYLDLIDQNPQQEIPVSFIAKIVAIIKYIIALIKSIIIK